MDSEKTGNKSTYKLGKPPQDADNSASQTVSSATKGAKRASYGRASQTNAGANTVSTGLDPSENPKSSNSVNFSENEYTFEQKLDKAKNAENSDRSFAKNTYENLFYRALYEGTSSELEQIVVHYGNFLIKIGENEHLYNLLDKTHYHSQNYNTLSLNILEVIGKNYFSLDYLKEAGNVFDNYITRKKLETGAAEASTAEEGASQDNDHEKLTEQINTLKAILREPINEEEKQAIAWYTEDIEKTIEFQGLSDLWNKFSEDEKEKLEEIKKNYRESLDKTEMSAEEFEGWVYQRITEKLKMMINYSEEKARKEQEERENYKKTAEFYEKLQAFYGENKDLLYRIFSRDYPKDSSKEEKSEVIVSAADKLKNLIKLAEELSVIKQENLDKLYDLRDMFNQYFATNESLSKELEIETNKRAYPGMPAENNSNEKDFHLTATGENGTHYEEGNLEE